MTFQKVSDRIKDYNRQFNKIYFFIGGKVRVHKKHDALKMPRNVFNEIYNKLTCNISKPEHKFAYFVSSNNNVMISANDICKQDAINELPVNYLLNNNYAIFWSNK